MIDLLFVIAIFSHFGLSIWLWNISKSKQLIVFADSIVNPIVFFNILLIFFGLDFIALYLAEVNIEIYELALPVGREDILFAYIFFIMGSACMILGIVFAIFSNTSRNILFVITKENKIRVQIVLLFIVLGALVALYFVAQSFNLLLSGEVTRQTFFYENKIVFIIFSMLIPAYAVFISGKRATSLWVIFVTIGVMALLFFAGSRGALILVALVYAYAYSMSIRKIPLAAYIVATPCISFGLLYLRYYFRETWRYSSLGDFIDGNGGVFSVFFNTAEISMADVIAVILKYGDTIPRYPFESFFAALLYPVPRALLDVKPLGGDAAVTSLFSPQRWDLSRSEITITLFSDYYLQFGAFLTFPLLIITGFLWMKGILIGVKMGVKGVILVPFLMWGMYLILRSSVFNVAGLFWAWSLVMLLTGIRFKSRYY